MVNTTQELLYIVPINVLFCEVHLFTEENFTTIKQYILQSAVAIYNKEFQKVNKLQQPLNSRTDDVVRR
jgi:hypothetical protein